MSTELNELLERNRQWAAKTEARSPSFFSRLLKQQTPQYLWIGCADSRVPANELVDLLPGEAVRAPQHRQRDRPQRPQRAVGDPVRGRCTARPAHHHRRALQLRRRQGGAEQPAHRAGRQLAAPHPGRAQPAPRLPRQPAGGPCASMRWSNSTCWSRRATSAAPPSSRTPGSAARRSSCTAGSTDCTTGCWKTCASRWRSRMDIEPAYTRALTAVMATYTTLDASAT